MNEAPRKQIAARGTHTKVLEMLQGEPDIRRVLDIPSGAGAMCERLLQHGYEVLAADVGGDPGLPGVRFLSANMNAPLPLADGELDAIVCIDGIEHIERPYDFAAECARVLRPDGVLIVSTPNISSLRSRWRWLWTGFHDGRKTPLDENNPNPLHHINMIEFHKLRYMLHRVGLRITGIGTNRCKAVALLYAPLVPLAWLLTCLVFATAIRRPTVRPIAREVLRQMFTRPVLFGDALIVKALRRPASGPTASIGS